MEGGRRVSHATAWPALLRLAAVSARRGGGWRQQASVPAPPQREAPRAAGTKPWHAPRRRSPKGGGPPPTRPAPVQRVHVWPQAREGQPHQVRGVKPQVVRHVGVGAQDGARTRGNPQLRGARGGAGGGRGRRARARVGVGAAQDCRGVGGGGRGALRVEARQPLPGPREPPQNPLAVASPAVPVHPAARRRTQTRGHARGPAAHPHDRRARGLRRPEHADEDGVRAAPREVGHAGVDGRHGAALGDGHHCAAGADEPRLPRGEVALDVGGVAGRKRLGPGAVAWLGFGKRATWLWGVYMGRPVEGADGNGRRPAALRGAAAGEGPRAHISSETFFPSSSPLL